MFQWIGATAKRIETWHKQTVIMRWPYQPAMTRTLLLATMALAALAILMNMQVRNAQYQAWATFHSADETLLFSTTDAPYFLGLAGALQRGETNADYESLLSYPDNMRKAQETPDTFNEAPLPLLSILLSRISPSDGPEDLLRTGKLLVIICSGITAGLIILAFAATGYWLEGAVAATGAGLSAAYLVRTSAGRIDTDMLNMGLLYVTFGAALLAGRATSARYILIWCALAGGMARLFLTWYDRSQLVWLVLAALIWLLLVGRRSPLPAVGGIILFVLVSRLDFFNPFSSGYLVDTLNIGAFVFPNTLSTITEASNLTLPNAMTQATGSIEMGLVCLVGCALWAVRHPVMATAMSPLLALGLLNFITGNRFIFYATPMLWFGFGYLLTFIAGFIQRELNGAESKVTLARTAMPAFVTLVGLTIAWVNTPTKYVPRVTFPHHTLVGFASLNSEFDPANTVVATWWDYGYASTFLNRLPVLHYGGSVNTAATHVVARALLDDDQTASLGMLKYLSNDGSRGINSQTSADSFAAAFYDAAEKPSPDLLLVVTNQMTGWISSISKIGNWDIEQGEPVQLRGNPDGAEVHYKPLNCRFNAYPQQLDCSEVRIDLERGLIDGQPLLVGWAHTQDGDLLRRRDFDHDTDHAIQIVQNGRRISAYFLHRQLYESTFNKLYYQGLMEHPSISLHYDDYPHIRIYKVDGTPTS